MRHIRRMLNLILKLFNRSKIYYFGFVLISFVAFAFISVLINNSSYMNWVEYGSSKMNIHFLGTLSPYTSITAGFSPYAEVFPSASYLYLNQNVDINKERCIIYDIRLAPHVEPLFPVCCLIALVLESIKKSTT